MEIRLIFSLFFVAAFSRFSILSMDLNSRMRTAYMISLYECQYETLLVCGYITFQETNTKKYIEAAPSKLVIFSEENKREERLKKSSNSSCAG